MSKSSKEFIVFELNDVAVLFSVQVDHNLFLLMNIMIGLKLNIESKKELTLSSEHGIELLNYFYS